MASLIEAVDDLLKAWDVAIDSGSGSYVLWAEVNALKEAYNDSVEKMTDKQDQALRRLCSRYGVDFDTQTFRKASRIDGLPDGYVCGWVAKRIYVGCSPEGEISS